MDARFAADPPEEDLPCPAAGVPRTAALDAISPDNMYYVNLVNHKGLLTSDQDLFTDPRTRTMVTKFAQSQRAFSQQFAVSMLKMGQLNVLTGSQGQIRRTCSAPNNPGTGAGLLLRSVLHEEAESTLQF